MTKTVEMRLTAIRYLAHETNLFEFETLDGGEVPTAKAGAHIAVNLPNDMVRLYSLVNPVEHGNRYTIGVKRDQSGRGGSVCLHDAVRVGSVLKIRAPRNNFTLDENAGHSVLIAGGIGITPIWSMAQRLTELGRSFELHYACRDRRDVAFAELIGKLANANIHIDSEAACFLDIGSIIENAPAGSHFYCCGPGPMLDTFEDRTSHLPPEQVHLERFAPAQQAALDGGFVVALEDSGQEFDIPKGQSILGVLRDAGFNLDFSCEMGICGACQVKVLDGIPDHQDMVLSDEEKARGDTMMICCSGSKTARLTLAL
ncbi:MULTISPECIES: 2Fe-2S iron-sulfur cluster-binding protein [unclassified Sinorhizobium]|uniref:PDR/VanB family oxidoreductase n=1 Tax=unclassified Sinorhizobium TaxID=2613772 RepID=UPI00352387B5